MNKSITFIRHGPPEMPFPSFESMPFAFLCDLATQKVDPGVDRERTTALLELLREKHPPADIVLSGQLRRARETGMLAADMLGIPFGRTTELLNEIHFDPAELTTESAFASEGMETIRNSLFHGMRTGVGAETTAQVLERISLLERELRSMPEGGVLCVTHSFFMRMLRLYYLEGKTSAGAIDASDLARTHDHVYADGFTIELTR